MIWYKQVEKSELMTFNSDWSTILYVHKAGVERLLRTYFQLIDNQGIIAVAQAAIED